MNKFVSSAIILTGLSLSVASLVFAEYAAPAAVPMGHKPMSTSTSSSTMASSVTSIEGSITSMDLTSANPSVTITTAAGKTEVVQIDPSTTISKSGQSLKLSDLKSGAQVRVRRTQKSGKTVAKSIQLS